VLSGRGLYFRLITRPEESYRVWCVWVWSWNLDNEEALVHKGLSRYGVEKTFTLSGGIGQNKEFLPYLVLNIICIHLHFHPSLVQVLLTSLF
jgi:hypothetical protein